MSKKKYNNESYSPRDYDKYEAQRAELQAETNGLRKGDNYHPKVDNMSTERFAKTEEEKLQLKDMKRANKLFLKKANLDPKKYMNNPNSNMGVIKGK